MDKKNLMIEKVVEESLWTGHTPETVMETSEGKYRAKATTRTKKEYVENVLNWNKIFKNIINEIINYASNSDYDIDNYKNYIDSELSKIEKVKLEVVENTAKIITGEPDYSRVSMPRFYIIKKGTILYRYTDDIEKHKFANPSPQSYGRFTVPGKIGTFYLAFDKNVAKDEVRGSNSNKLIKFRTIKDINALIMPEYLPEFSDADRIIATRLKKFHNLIFSLTVNDKYFEEIDIKNTSRLKEGIYIVTNRLLDIIKENGGDIIVYPSTKVKENSNLGNIENDKYFVPNKSNANLAIFNDVNYDDFGKQFSNFVESIN